MRACTHEARGSESSEAPTFKTDNRANAELRRTLILRYFIGTVLDDFSPAYVECPP